MGGSVGTSVTAPGNPPTQFSGSGVGAGANGSSVTCTWTEESAYIEAHHLDWWNQGEPGGRWFNVQCSDGTTYGDVYVPPAGTGVPSPVVQAGDLARSARNKLHLPEPKTGHNPARLALVGLATWWWIEPAQWRPLRQRTQAGPVWAEVTATPVSTTWDAGDGSAPVVCPGPGTPYDTTQPEAGQSTDCSHTYRRTTADQPQTGPSVNDRFFTVTVTTSWQVTWIGSAGSGGTLPVLTTSSTFPLAVSQRETVVTGGSG
jgi:hypothetical protein